MIEKWIRKKWLLSSYKNDFCWIWITESLQRPLGHTTERTFQIIGTNYLNSSGNCENNVAVGSSEGAEHTKFSRWKFFFVPSARMILENEKKKYIIWPKAPFHTQFASSGRNFRMVACGNKANNKLLPSTNYMNEVLPTKFHVNSLEWA